MPCPHRRFLLALTAALALAAAAPARAADTVVSLTFDDGRADTYVGKDILAQHGMRATLYINSGNVGTSSFYLTWPQIREFANGGNEIAGHTLTHTNLTTLTYDQAKSDVCADRQNLIAQGYSPTSFAYPFAAWNATAKQAVQDCGYASARGVGNGTETIPPRDAFVLRTPPDVQSGTSLSTIQSYVTQAENNGGGWVILVFHSICSGCSTNSITQANFTALLDWLQPRAANGTVVKTVAEVMGGSPPPPPPPPSPISLSTRAYKVKGVKKVDLTWSGATSTQVDVIRDGTRLATTTNSGAYTDTLAKRGTATYRYRVCESGTTVCSNESVVTF